LEYGDGPDGSFCKNASRFNSCFSFLEIDGALLRGAESARRISLPETSDASPMLTLSTPFSWTANWRLSGLAEGACNSVRRLFSLGYAS